MPVLQQLHWLPVHQRVQFKITVLMYKALHDLLSSYNLCLLQDIDDCLRRTLTRA